MRALFSEAARDLRFSWRSLFFTDLAYKVLAFAVISPVIALALRWLMTRRNGPAVADVDILWFFVTTRSGLLMLVFGGALLSAVTALEVACLMAVALAASEGRHLLPRHALAFGARDAWRILGLTLQMVLRVLAILVPFGVVAGVTYVTFLHKADINFYIAKKPPEFWKAAAILGVLGVFLVYFVVRIVSRWTLALPMMLFENVPARRALGEAGRRSQGYRGTIVGTTVIWAALAMLLVFVSSYVPEAIGRMIAPGLHASLSGLTVFVLALMLLWGALSLAVGIFNVSFFSTLVVRLYRRASAGRDMRQLEGAVEGAAPEAWKHRGRVVAGLAAVAVLVAVGLTLIAVVGSSRDQKVVVIAHRGASAVAPENTLAAFRLAADEKTDFVELDVQESMDGEVLVVHDSDLMRVGGFPGKIWEATAQELRAVPIAWRTEGNPPEHLPTLAEALAVCKGRCKVVVELKQYGHDQRLEERVVEIVERAGMVDDCIYMSLDRGMVHKMKQLRPAWTSGLLVAEAMGDLTKLDADFYAVRAPLATRRFVRRVHAEGREVYVWTVNDPAWMLSAMSRGVDGLITDRPEVAREVVGKRAAMSDAERAMMALLIRLGARPETLGPEQ